MLRKRPAIVECPVELTRFVPEEWPASQADIDLMGASQTSPFFAWIRWLHARAEYEERRGIRDLPDETTQENMDRKHDIFRAGGQQ